LSEWLHTSKKVADDFDVWKEIDGRPEHRVWFLKFVDYVDIEIE
jgi:hypothetical protein